MSDLSNDIYSYFLDNFHELPLDKQLHFTSRLWLWRKDEAARTRLDELRKAILPSENIEETLKHIGDGTLLPLRPGSANVVHLRQHYFDTYPGIRRVATVLYWGLVLDACYGTDSRAALKQSEWPPNLNELYNTLLNDRQAVAILSTHAVNFFYLYTYYYSNDLPKVEPEYFASIASDKAFYTSDDPLYLQLRIYLLTHTVIGASLFYTQPIAAEGVSHYRDVVKQLEPLMQNHFSEINLDNKLEFLVCCLLVGHSSSLEASILDEARDSVSTDGTFLVDRHNSNQQQAYTSFDKSEHRSVLYLMVTTKREKILCQLPSDAR